MKTFTLNNNGTSEELPLETVENLLDKVLSAAWRAAKYNGDASFDFHGQVIDIRPERFEYPISDDVNELIAHLHYYNIMLEYNPEIEPAQCAEWLNLTRAQFKKFETAAIQNHLPMFRHVRRTKSNHGGARENAGRKGTATAQVSACVPPDTLDTIRSRAAADGVSLSSKVCEILKNWARRNPVQE